MANKDNDQTRPLAPGELQAMIDRAYRPGILMNKMPRPDDPGAPGCWLGGEPTLPPTIEWPWFLVDGQPLVPMHHMAQINLAEVPRLEQHPKLPETGTLFVFFAPEVLSGSTIVDRNGGSRIIYVPEDVSKYPLRIRCQSFPISEH